ncbi:RPA-interacting A [Pelobates cultripes]|uniref:RPA-interacting A n=1 Tax=Pelobates cultripes TaxID=61616 RepID=A0AAD1R320_PELCU|nr:RPA-interacting A [Pelobates cultripes]
MESAMKHRALYKGTTPPWKETYRKRCVERLKSNRSKLLDKFRQVGDRLHSGTGNSLLVEEVMEEEWAAMQSDHKGFPSLWNNGTFSQALGILTDPDELATLEEIKRELRVEEQAMIEEIENILQFEEECLDSVVGLNVSNQIVCPVCNRHNLTVTSCFIVCQCGVHINTQSQGMSIEKLRSLLETNLTAHGYNCCHHPVFSVVTGMEGIPSLFMSCHVCDAMTIVV